MLEHEVIGPGGHVLVHAGYAVDRISKANAKIAWALYDEIFELAAANGAEVGQALRE
jgi:hydrogenase maturation factor